MKRKATAWLPRELLAAMADEAERRAPLETGGVLLGYWAECGTHVVVTDVVGPGPGAVHTRDSFVPDDHYHEREVACRYRASGRRSTYLGDWHTHPGAAAYLSPRDRRTLERIGADAEARAPMPLMVILAPGPEWEPRAWRGEWRGWLLGCRRQRVRPMIVEVFDTPPLPEADERRTIISRRTR